MDALPLYLPSVVSLAALLRIFQVFDLRTFCGLARRFRYLTALVWMVIAATAVSRFGSTGLLAAEAVEVREKSGAEAAVERRLDEAVRYLAADDLEGRGLGTEGIDAAAEYLAEQFRSLGLKTELFDGTPFQTFTVTISSKLGSKEKNLATLVPPTADGEPIDLKLGTDFNPLAVGGSDEFDLPLVFAGYGITSADDNYDDFAGIDVKGKAVVILRHEPQHTNPHGAFQGTKDTPHAAIVRKASNAYQHGAEAVILVTGEAEIEKNVTGATRRVQQAIEALAKANEEFKELEEPSREEVEAYRKKIQILGEQLKSASERIEREFDPVLDFRRGGEVTDSRRKFAVLHMRREAIDRVFQAALSKTLSELEKQIDEELKPRSQELAGWRIRGQTDIERIEAPSKNVVAVLEGEGEHADETIIVGAHYDHLGRGGSGSLARDSSDIHNGADDNASGTAVLVEVARQLAGREKKLPRRVAFIAFTGEERGLLGSAHYVHQPLYPLDKTVAMLNMDMVGRLQDDRLVIYGTKTAKEFDELIDQLNERHGFTIKREPGGFGPSDHASFFAVKVPVLHFFTGIHNDYHRPSDDANKLNVPGMRRVGEMVSEAVIAIAEREERPEFTQPPAERSRPRPMGDRPYFGSVPKFIGGGDEGYAIQGVSKDSPAEKGGLQGGDVIIQFGDSRIGGLDDFDAALRKYKAGDSVPVVVKREGKEVKLEVVLESPR